VTKLSLSDGHLAMLAKDSGLPRDVIVERGYRTVTEKDELKDLGFAPAQARVPALLIPLHDVNGPNLLHVLRPDQPRKIRKKPLKYEYPKGERLILDVPPRAQSRLGDPAQILYVTEGAKKATALAAQGVCAINLNGVWGWKGRNPAGGKTALPDWDAAALNGRSVVLAFDSDVTSKPEVAKALGRLKNFLELRGAVIRILYLPEDGFRQAGRR